MLLRGGIFLSPLLKANSNRLKAAAPALSQQFLRGGIIGSAGDRELEAPPIQLVVMGRVLKGIGCWPCLFGISCWGETREEAVAGGDYGGRHESGGLSRSGCRALGRRARGRRGRAAAPGSLRMLGLWLRYCLGQQLSRGLVPRELTFRKVGSGPGRGRLLC